MKARDRIEVLEREFNRVGEEGWELCSDHGGSYTFKRRRTEWGQRVRVARCL
jgi:hypothetical protein